MVFTLNILTLASIVAAAVTVITMPAVAVAGPTPLPAPEDGTMGASDLLTWLSTTDANITYTGGPVSRDVGGNVMVVYCNKRTVNVCGGDCTVYNGGAKCINAPGTSCLMSTANVGFCDRGNCGGSCNQLSTCGTHLDDNFCFTPGTASINVPFV